MIKVVWLAPFPVEGLKSVRFSKPVKSYGTGTWLVNLAFELVKNENIELHVICETANIPYDQDFSENKIQFHLIRNNVPFTNRGYPGYFPFPEISGYFFNTLKIKKLLKRIKPDLVHAQGTENSYAIAALKSGFPNVVSIQGVIREISKFQPSCRMKLKARLEKIAVKSGHHFICRTNLDTSLIDLFNPGAVKHIVYEAINPVFFKTRWIVQNESNLLFVGSLQEYKGITVLLKAIITVIKSIPDISLFVIGSGSTDYIKKLESICKEGSISENVRFMGYQSPGKIAEFHLRSQIMICSSLIENSPNAVAEAMVSGMPVIATRAGGIPSMIEDNKNGILVEPENAELLTDKIIYLLNNPEERKRLGNNAMKVAREKYLPSLVSMKTFEVYESILKNSVVIKTADLFTSKQIK